MPAAPPSTSSDRPAPRTLLARWAEMLERVARPVVNGETAAALDERLATAVARSTSALGVVMWRQRRYSDAPSPGAGASPPLAAKEDVALWWQVERQPGGLIGQATGAPDLTSIEAIVELATEHDTSLFSQHAYRTIEVWTETELSALHALSHLANIHPGHAGERIARRVRQLIDWHIERTQPDNATNHPWAVHAFVHANTPESLHFAETMVSNCQVQSGRPDIESAWILLDSADALREATEGGRRPGT